MDENKTRQDQEALSGREMAERTGRTEEVTGEKKSFKADQRSKDIPGANDLEGPAGDPAEGKPTDSAYPA